MTPAEIRQAFEEWARQPPMEWSCERYADVSAWPGAYRDYAVHAAYEAWVAALAWREGEGKP